MTIAIGFSYGFLSVMASDSEITAGGHAIPRDKISSIWRAEPSGSEKSICLSDLNFPSWRLFRAIHFYKPAH